MHKEKHLCYNTDVYNATAVFEFKAPHVCTINNYCSVILSTLHTWNTSYIGPLNCDLYAYSHNHSINQHHHHSKNSTLISGVLAKDGTVPKDTQLTFKATGGKHILKCTNMERNKEAGIMGISTTISTVL